MVGKIALFLNILELSEASALSRSTVYNTEEKYTSFNRLSPSDDSNTATHSLLNLPPPSVAPSLLTCV